MAQETEKERKKGAVPIPFGGAVAHPTFFATLIATGAGRMALVSLTAAVGCGLYGVSLALAAFNAPPAPKVAPAKLNAPADPTHMRQIDPQTSMDVVPIVADGVRAAEQSSEMQAALAAAAQNANVPTVAAPPMDPAAVAAQALAAAGAAPNGAPQAAPARGRLAGVRRPGNLADAQAAAQQQALAGNGSATAGAVAGGLQPSFQQTGQSRAFDKNAPPATTRYAAAVGRASGSAGGRGSMRQLRAANGLSHGGGGEASMSHGAQAFDGGAAINSTVASGPQGPTQAQQEAAAATESDYGGDGAPMNAQQPHGGGGTFAPAPDAGHKNATPWQGLVEAATYLSLSASMLLLLEMWFASMARHGPPHGWAFMLAARWTAGVATAMGLAAVGIGAKIMSMGQTSQGLMMVLGGGLITAMAIVALIKLFDPKAALVAKTGAAASQASTAVSAGAAHAGAHGPVCLPPR